MLRIPSSLNGLQKVYEDWSYPLFEMQAKISTLWKNLKNKATERLRAFKCLRSIYSIGK